MIKKTMNFLSEFSIPLISGVVMGLILGNLHYEALQNWINAPILPGLEIFGHKVSVKFLVNDIFMVFFFGIATVEIVQAFQKGGSMYPLKKSVNPIMGAFGGIIVPIILFLLFCMLFQVDKGVYRGWGIASATDIAIAWLFARFCFGIKHPIISFLLLIAVLDDAVGLVIIGIGYPNPNYPIQLEWLSLVLVGILFCYVLNKMRVKSFVWYIGIGGVLSWIGLLKTGVHPALALVVIIPFLSLADTTQKTEEHSVIFEDEPSDSSPMTDFEHFFKYIVDIGLFGFGIVNTAVMVNSFSVVSLIVFLSLFFGKTIGIFTFSVIFDKLGFHLPEKVNYKVLFLAAMIAGIGLTVAIFMSNVAYTDIALQNSAKMGALLSLFIGFIVLILSRILSVKRID